MLPSFFLRLVAFTGRCSLRCSLQKGIYMSLKTCSTCGERKDETEFNYRNKLIGRRWGTCKECQSRQRADWYQKNKESHIENVNKNRKRLIQQSQQFVWDYLTTHPCVDCGESNPTVLEFDHVRGKKVKAISDFARQGYAISTIQAEISKCVVRCANCHRIKTHKERGWFRG